MTSRSCRRNRRKRNTTDPRYNEAGQLNEVRWVSEFLCFCSEAIHSARQPWGQRARHEALVDMKLLVREIGTGPTDPTKYYQPLL
jgi:hypothetical protein